MQRIQKIAQGMMVLLICFTQVLFASSELLVSNLKQIIAHKPMRSNLTADHEIYFKNIALVLFYMSSCPHCQRFDPILATFTQQKHIPILAYTLDGEALPSFPNSVTPNESELMKFFPHKNIVVPTLFLIDLKTHRIYPMLQGEATHEQLSMRFKTLVTAIHQSALNTNLEPAYERIH